MNIWDCLEQLERENNPRLMVIVEAADAHYLLAMRDALRALATTRITKGKVANAKQLLAQPWKEVVHDDIPHHQTGAVGKPRTRRARRA